MQKKLLIVIAILLAIPTIARAGIYGTIEGRVLDIKGKPLGGATVKVLGTKRGANAKADGSFKINQLEATVQNLVDQISFLTKSVPELK